jgi:nicotinate-nucleotide--dimethylbenzimidazole phosphoribosyltransferase
MSSLQRSLAATLAAIRPVDPALGLRVQARLDAKTKPPGSLGRLEALAVRLAAARGVEVPELPVKAVVVMAADHGVTAEGVSAYPAEVTAQMVANFAHGGAAINALARTAGAEVVVVDMGVRAPVALPGVLSRRIGPGTGNLAVEAAMSRAQAVAALEAGIALVHELADRGVTLLAAGEMGIGNTTAAAALAACLLGEPPEALVGRGTGVDDAGLRRKAQVIGRGLALHAPAVRAAGAEGPLEALARLGGFELAGMAGLCLGAAERRLPLLVDGFISSAAALAATRLAPAVAGYLVLAHRSAEAGHRRVVEALGIEPLLDLGLRLGEGTGAALAMPLCEAAIRVLREMATFADAGVADRTGAAPPPPEQSSRGPTPAAQGPAARRPQ